MGTVIGLIVTGLLLFALTPIYNFAVRISDRAMPGVHDTPEYITFKKLEIYGEAFSEAIASGGVSTAKRAALNRLRAHLDLSEEETRLLEAEFVAA